MTGTRTASPSVGGIRARFEIAPEPGPGRESSPSIRTESGRPCCRPRGPPRPRGPGVRHHEERAQPGVVGGRRAERDHAPLPGCEGGHRRLPEDGPAGARRRRGAPGSRSRAPGRRSGHGRDLDSSPSCGEPGRKPRCRRGRSGWGAAPPRKGEQGEGRRVAGCLPSSRPRAARTRASRSRSSTPGAEAASASRACKDRAVAYGVLGLSPKPPSRFCRCEQRGGRGREEGARLRAVAFQSASARSDLGGDHGRGLAARHDGPASRRRRGAPEVHKGGPHGGVRGPAEAARARSTRAVSKDRSRSRAPREAAVGILAPGGGTCRARSVSSWATPSATPRRGARRSRGSAWTRPASQARPRFEAPVAPSCASASRAARGVARAAWPAASSQRPSSDWCASSQASASSRSALGSGGCGGHLGEGRVGHGHPAGLGEEARPAKASRMRLDWPAAPRRSWAACPAAPGRRSRAGSPSASEASRGCAGPRRRRLSPIVDRLGDVATTSAPSTGSGVRVDARGCAAG